MLGLELGTGVAALCAALSFGHVEITESSACESNRPGGARRAVLRAPRTGRAGSRSPRA